MTIKNKILTVVSVLAFATFAASSDRGFSHDIKGDGPKPWTHLNFQDNADDFQFAIVPDRTGGNCRGAFTNALAKLNLLRPEFVMTVGDLIEGLRPPKVIRPQQIELTNLTSKVIAPFFYVVGNHDIGRSRPDYPLNNEESLAVWNEFYGNRTYYSFMYRGVLFVVLNTMEGRDSRRPQRGITKEQYAWFKDTLDKHSDARWTMIFMHQPAEWKTAAWEKFENTELCKRKYTVFAGDWHHYIYARRHGREYYVLGVAGGFGAAAFDDSGRIVDWHAIHGKEHGEIEHVTWVTMTKDGPVVANLTLDGILPGNFLTQRNTLSEGQLVPLDEPVDKVVVERFKQMKAKIAARKAQKPMPAPMPKVDDRGLWRLSFRAGTNGKEVVLDSSKYPTYVEETTPTGRRLTWRGVNIDSGDCAVDVVCSIDRNRKHEWDEYRISVKNRSSKYGLFETEYPRFNSLLKPGEGSLVRPGGCWGGQRLRENVAGRFPFPDWASPFQIAIFEKDAGGGALVAALDTKGVIKFLNYSNGFDFSVSTPAVDAGVSGKAGAHDFAVAICGFNGNWVDAAKIYRKWSVENAEWMKKGPLVSRKDRSMDFRDIGMWFLFQHGHDKPLSHTEKQIDKALSIVDGRFPLAVHIYSWHKHPHDVLVPDYFPGRAGFSDMVARLTKKGVRTMPYLNGRIWDWGEEGFKKVEKWMCRLSDGKLHNERWGNRDFSAVCPSSKMWGDWLVELGEKMVNEYGVGALYYDQIASMTAVPCYASNHGHPVGGGMHWVEGYRKAMERVNAAVPETVLTSENWSEPYTDLFDGFLVWGPNVGNDVPLTPAVYSGYMSPFACRMSGDVTDQAFFAMQARSFLWGAQTGWEKSWILEDKYRKRLDFIIKLAEKRRTALEYFADGEFLGPVENGVKCEPLRFEVVRWQRRPKVEIPPVMAAAWKSPSGGRLIAIVNAGLRKNRFEAEGISLELDPLEIVFVNKDSRSSGK